MTVGQSTVGESVDSVCAKASTGLDQTAKL